MSSYFLDTSIILLKKGTIIGHIVQLPTLSLALLQTLSTVSSQTISAKDKVDPD